MRITIWATIVILMDVLQKYLKVDSSSVPIIIVLVLGLIICFMQDAVEIVKEK